MAGSPLIFDRALIRTRARRPRDEAAAAFLIERVADDLAERLGTVLRTFAVAVDLGTPTDAVRKRLAGNDKVGAVIAAGVAGRGLSVVADEEFLPFGHATLDLVVSALALQAVNDLPGALIQIRRALKPDGLFLAALLGGETLMELRESFFAAEAEIEGGASPRVIPFVDVREAGTLLQRAGFALPVVDVDRITVRYSSPFGLLRDLRSMGAANPLHDRRRLPLRRATLARMAEIYAEKYSDADGRLRATVDVVWLSGWAPHENQQKPLAPGSARTRLADALGTSELSTGEKPER
jgi:SAM-dependent methyltransferase